MSFTVNHSATARLSYLFLPVVMCATLLFPNPGTASAGQPDSLSTDITLSTHIDRAETPLNKPVSLSVILNWKGRPTRYTIDSFETPVLTNLEIIGSQSTSRTELRNGEIFSVKEYTYTLLLQEMGMGYIEPIIIDYTDTMTDSRDRLLTQRMQVKGLPPVYERSYSWLWAGIGFAVVAALLIWLVFRARRKAAARRQEEIQAQPKTDTITEQLKNIHADKHLPFSRKLDRTVSEFRKHLIREFDIPEDRRSDALILEALEEAHVDEELISHIRSIVEQAEHLRFSGREVTNDEFELLFGSVEKCVENCSRGDANTGES